MSTVKVDIPTKTVHIDYNPQKVTQAKQEFGEVIAAIEQFAERNLADLAEVAAVAELRSSQSA